MWVRAKRYGLGSRSIIWRHLLILKGPFVGRGETCCARAVVPVDERGAAQAAAQLLHITTQQPRLTMKLAHPQRFAELAAAACQLVECILHDVLPADPDVQASDHARVHPLEDGLQQQRSPFAPFFSMKDNAQPATAARLCGSGRWVRLCARLPTFRPMPVLGVMKALTPP